jgi:BirA family transcriptional regulator, biotin operon repressor / biotin---[acetyl-CoA-carboxylase] ligase
LRIIRLDSVDSTNLEAQRRAATGERGPLWIAAGEQTAGRGRLGRRWISKPGNVYSTLIWPTAALSQALSQLSFVAALAVFDAASRFVKSDAISLKWPNDCMLDGAKFSGILVESLGPGLVAIGIGINVAHVPEDLPYRAERLDKATAENVFRELVQYLAQWLTTWKEGNGFSEIVKAWEARCRHIGQPVTVDGEQGTFTGLASDGALLLKRSNGIVKAVYAGDVRVEYQPSP